MFSKHLAVNISVNRALFFHPAAALVEESEGGKSALLQQEHTKLQLSDVQSETLSRPRGIWMERRRCLINSQGVFSGNSSVFLS